MSEITSKPFIERLFVTKKENVYFVSSVILSAIINILLFCCTLFIGYACILLYFGILILFVQGISVAYIKQNSIKITNKQFPDIYEKIKSMAFNLNIENVPDVYMMQSDGILNAFATRFLFKNYVILYSDVMELAYKEGEPVVDFIIAHELAHVKRKHLSKQIWTFWGLIMPFLGSAYSRACETTCDNIATYFIPERSTDGLMVLMSGKELYKKIDIQDMLENANKNYGFWAWLCEINSSHPALAKRIYNVLKINEKLTGNKTNILTNKKLFCVPSWVTALIIIFAVSVLVLPFLIAFMYGFLNATN